MGRGCMGKKQRPRGSATFRLNSYKFTVLIRTRKRHNRSLVMRWDRGTLSLSCWKQMFYTTGDRAGLGRLGSKIKALAKKQSRHFREQGHALHWRHNAPTHKFRSRDKAHHKSTNAHIHIYIDIPLHTACTCIQFLALAARPSQARFWR